MKRSMTVAAAVIAIATVSAVAQAHHRPGHAGGSAAADLSLAANPPITVFRAPVVLSGGLKGANNAGVSLTLRADPFPFGNGEKVVATGKTDAKGDYSFTQRPFRNTSYRVTATSTPAVPLPTPTVPSPRVIVNVRIRIGLRVSDATPRAGTVIRLRGRACPAHDGRRVRIQRRTATGTFVTVRRATLRAATRCSTYSRRIRVFRDGTYRASVDDADHARGFSPARAIDVHR